VLDATPPRTAYAYSREPVVRPPRGEPWFPEDFDVLWSAADAPPEGQAGPASGAAFVSPPTRVAAEGRGLAFTGSARDRVDNAGSTTAVVNVDKTEAGRRATANSKKKLTGHVIAEDSLFDVVRRTAKIAGM